MTDPINPDRPRDLDQAGDLETAERVAESPFADSAKPRDLCFAAIEGVPVIRRREESQFVNRGVNREAGRAGVLESAVGFFYRERRE